MTRLAALKHSVLLVQGVAPAAAHVAQYSLLPPSTSTTASTSACASASAGAALPALIRKTLELAKKQSDEASLAAA